MSKIIDTYERVINNEYTFETKEYSEAIDVLTGIYKESNSINMLFNLANSSNFSVIFALSYILENTCKDFLLTNRVSICKILKIAIRKKYFRANFYFCNILIDLMQDEDDYRLYLEIIKSENEIEHNNAIYNLIYLKQKDFLLLDKISCYDFSIFYANNSKDINDKWFSNRTKNSDLIYKKILLTSAYYKIRNKEFVYSITDRTNPNLFDFVFFLP